MSIEVHIDWKGRTHHVGRLDQAKQGPAVSFEYAPEWLDHDGAFAVDPTALPLRKGPQHSASLFGALQDCGPDRWGKLLIERAVRKKLLVKKPYQDVDYVLALDDATRLGALRFRVSGGPFLAETGGTLPPLVRLGALMHATDAIHGDTETAQDLKFLLGAGSPLGGARPKAAVGLPDNGLAIAKFPKPDDTRDIAAGEILALSLALKAGIRTAQHRLVPVAGRNVSVITRFDRAAANRVPFVSAASLLGLAPGDNGAYTQLAEGIRQLGAEVTVDLAELWRRLVFSLLISNYDDHMRNHAFLMPTAGRWSLSPAYDLNPVPEIDRVRMSKTSITEGGELPTVALALEVAPRFGLKVVQAKRVLHEVYSAASAWRMVGRALKIKAATLDAYASAFEQPLMEEARDILGK
jgi:serine/threonine-protein kinase HipA